MYAAPITSPNHGVPQPMHLTIMRRTLRLGRGSWGNIHRDDAAEDWKSWPPFCSPRSFRSVIHTTSATCTTPLGTCQQAGLIPPGQVLSPRHRGDLGGIVILHFLSPQALSIHSMSLTMAPNKKGLVRHYYISSSHALPISYISI